MLQHMQRRGSFLVVLLLAGGTEDEVCPVFFCLLRAMACSLAAMATGRPLNIWSPILFLFLVG